MITDSLPMDRDCKPAKELTESYYHGACSVPLSADTIGDVLFSKDLDADKILFSSPEHNQRISIRELQRKAKLFSKWLLGNDLKKGEIVMVAGVADLDYLSALLGTVSIGCICQTVNGIYFKPILVQKVNPSAIIVGHHMDQEGLGLAERLQNTIGNNKTLNLKLVDILRRDHESSWRYLLEDAAVSDELYYTTLNSVSSEDPAIILRTTGSTGLSKAVLLSHKVLVNIGRLCFQRGRGEKQDNIEEIVALPNPINDDVQPPLLTILALLNWRSTTCTFSPTWLDYGCLDIERFAKFLEIEKITAYRGYPFEVITLVNSEFMSSYDISKLTSVNMVSQVVSKKMREKIFQHFHNSVVMYGSSECLVGTSTSPVLSSHEQRMNSIGYPFPHTELKIVGDNGEILPINTPGEICIKGFGVFSGYLCNESGENPVDVLGWLHMGDIGEMDETGHVTFIARKEEQMTFKHGGDKIYPKQITDVASTHPNIIECAVVGLQNDEKGDDIFLFCILKDEAQDSSVTLKDFLIQNAPHELVIADYVIPLQSLPRIGTRKKVDSQALRAMAIEIRQATSASN
ncbi:medium-chain acyl-CoA ligase ACSF2, mitochondrial-like isoform X3 [Crassostrea virginica]